MTWTSHSFLTSASAAGSNSRLARGASASEARRLPCWPDDGGTARGWLAGNAAAAAGPSPPSGARLLRSALMWGVRPTRRLGLAASCTVPQRG